MSVLAALQPYGWLLLIGVAVILFAAAAWWVIHLFRRAPLLGLVDAAIADATTLAGYPGLDATTGEHDRYPQLTDEVRHTCVGYLETLYALPSAADRRETP